MCSTKKKDTNFRNGTQKCLMKINNVDQVRTLMIVYIHKQMKFHYKCDSFSFGWNAILIWKFPCGNLRYFSFSCLFGHFARHAQVRCALRIKLELILERDWWDEDYLKYRSEKDCCTWARRRCRQVRDSERMREFAIILTTVRRQRTRERDCSRVNVTFTYSK